MPEDRLYAPQICPSFKEVGGATVPDHVGCEATEDSSLFAIVNE